MDFLFTNSAKLAVNLGLQVLTAIAFAQGNQPNYQSDQVYGKGLELITLDQATQNIQPGSIVVLGEQHGTSKQASQQMQILESIRKNNKIVSVGMEFFEAQDQALVNQWRAGQLAEADFLKAIGWGSFPFADYSGQAMFPKSEEGATTVALNASRKLTGKIAKVGLSGLSDEERAQLPPGFTLGNDRYFERFKEIMGGHLPSADAINRYFAAQSTWDEAMAYRATEYIKAHPDQILVIVVGEFHVQYGGGLPDRIQARGGNVTTFSLVNLAGLEPSDQIQAVQPSTVYGARADFVLTSIIEE